MSEQDRGLLVKVEFEYENGEINKLTGKKAQEWLAAVNGQVSIARIHGCNLPAFDWEILEKSHET